MFKRRTVSLFILSIVFAVGAAWIANNWINSQQPTVAKQENPGVPVVQAAIDIPYGHTLESRHIKVVMMPEDIAPTNSFRSPDDVLGKVSTDIMLPGEIIRMERVSDHLEGATLAALIEPNMRAFTVRVNDVVGVAGFLLPGNKVDVIASRSSGGQRIITETVLKDIRVLAVDQMARTDKNDPVVVRAVTLEVTPAQAERLARAKEEGRIQLTLRNPVEPPPQLVKAKPKRKPVYRSTPKVIVIKGTEWQSKKVPM